VLFLVQSLPIAIKVAATSALAQVFRASAGLGLVFV